MEADILELEEIKPNGGAMLNSGYEYRKRYDKKETDRVWVYLDKEEAPEEKFWVDVFKYELQSSDIQAIGAEWNATEMAINRAVFLESKLSNLRLPSRIEFLERKLRTYQPGENETQEQTEQAMATIESQIEGEIQKVEVARDRLTEEIIKLRASRPLKELFVDSMLTRVIHDWDLTDDHVKEPITREVMMQMPDELIGAIFMSLWEYFTRGKAKKKKAR